MLPEFLQEDGQQCGAGCWFMTRRRQESSSMVCKSQLHVKKGGAPKWRQHEQVWPHSNELGW